MSPNSRNRAASEANHGPGNIPEPSGRSESDCPELP